MTDGQSAFFERQIIRANTEILDGVLLTRAGIVVDFSENPEMYEQVYDEVDRAVTIDASNPVDLLMAVYKSARDAIPFDDYSYRRILRDEADLRGVEQLNPSHYIDLSRFFLEGGICHQQALLVGATLRLVQQRQGLGGVVSLESTRPNEFDEDRHVRIRYTTDVHDLVVDSDAVLGVQPA